MRWQFGAVQFSEFDADGFLGVQIDPARSGDDPGAASVSEVQAPYGFFSRPRDPEPDGLGCSVLTMQRGNRERYAWLGSDPRTLPLLPDGSKGSSYQFALTDSGELSFHEVDGETGTHSIYVPVGDSAHFVQIGVDSDGKSILKLQHSEGMAVVMFEETVIIHNATGDAYLQVDSTGVVCNGTLKATSGADIGGGGGVSLVMSPELAAALSTLASAVSTAAASASPGDGGKALGGAIAAALNTLVSAIASGGTKLLKGV